MNKPLLSLLCLAAMAGSCGSPGFTPEERKQIGINTDSQIMRLLTVDNSDDSLSIREKSRVLSDKELRSPLYATLKCRMLATVNDPDNAGVGIAAPQVGIFRRLIAVQRFDKQDDPFVFYANARIVHYSQTRTSGVEGCLSVPGKSGAVFRSDTVVVEYTDEKSYQTLRDTISGFTAVIFQHEIDHLEGVLYTDSLSVE